MPEIEGADRDRREGNQERKGPKLESEGKQDGKTRIQETNSYCMLEIGTRAKIPEPQQLNAKLRGCVRHILGQRPVHGSCIEHGYSL